MDFEEEHQELLSDYEKAASEIEYIIFTKRYHLAKKHVAILSTQSISMLYSYWEGYVQKSFQLYAEYINEQRVSFNDFSDDIKVRYMDSNFKQFRDYPKKKEKKINFFALLKHHYEEDIHEIPAVVNTESNVSFEVLNKLLEQFSLETFPEYWGDYRHPNPSLKEMMNTFLRYRNGVSHGGDISSEEKVTQEVYSKYRIMVKDLMYEMHNRFLNGISEQPYLKNPAIHDS